MAKSDTHLTPKGRYYIKKPLASSLPMAWCSMTARISFLLASVSAQRRFRICGADVPQACYASNANVSVSVVIRPCCP